MKLNSDLTEALGTRDCHPDGPCPSACPSERVLRQAKTQAWRPPGRPGTKGGRSAGSWGRSICGPEGPLDPQGRRTWRHDRTLHLGGREGEDELEIPLADQVSPRDLSRRVGTWGQHVLLFKSEQIAGPRPRSQHDQFHAPYMLSTPVSARSS